MKKVKKNHAAKSTCRCVICSTDASNGYIGSPFGTVICHECAHVIHQMIDQAKKGKMRNALFMHMVPTTGKPGFQPVIPVLID